MKTEKGENGGEARLIKREKRQKIIVLEGKRKEHEITNN